MFFSKPDTRTINEIADNIHQTKSFNNAINVILGGRSLKNIKEFENFEDGDAILKDIREKFDLTNSNEELTKNLEKIFIYNLAWRDDGKLWNLLEEEKNLQKMVQEGKVTRTTPPFDSKEYVKQNHAEKWTKFENELPKELQDLKNEKQQELKNVLLKFEKVVILLSEYSQLKNTPKNYSQKLQKLKKLEKIRQRVTDLDEVLMSYSQDSSAFNKKYNWKATLTFLLCFLSGVALGFGIGFTSGPAAVVVGPVTGLVGGAFGIFMASRLQRRRAIDEVSRDAEGKAIKAPDRNIKSDILRDLNAEIVKVIEAEQALLNKRVCAVTRAWVKAFA